jgi:hypothetical protein
MLINNIKKGIFIYSAFITIYSTNINYNLDTVNDNNSDKIVFWCVFNGF